MNLLGCSLWLLIENILNRDAHPQAAEKYNQ